MPLHKIRFPSCDPTVRTSWTAKRFTWRHVKDAAAIRAVVGDKTVWDISAHVGFSDALGPRLPGWPDGGRRSTAMMETSSSRAAPTSMNPQALRVRWTGMMGLKKRATMPSVQAQPFLPNPAARNAPRPPTPQTTHRSRT